MININYNIYIMIIKYLITGYCILLIAILSNAIAETIELETWYKFLKNINFSEIKNKFKDVGILNTLWLFVIYPLILSFGYLIGQRIYDLLI